MMFSRAPAPRIITFDCYGTLVQWREVLLREIGITAERAQAYKPSRQIFEHGYRTMGVTKDETVHVAMGMFLDIKACHDFGIRGIWINRRGEAGNPDWLPYTELPDLTGVPGLLMSD